MKRMVGYSNKMPRRIPVLATNLAASTDPDCSWQVQVEVF